VNLAGRKNKGDFFLQENYIIIHKQQECTQKSLGGCCGC